MNIEMREDILRKDVARLGREVEELMKVDYWQDRYNNIVVKERDEAIFQRDHYMKSDCKLELAAERARSQRLLEALTAVNHYALQGTTPASIDCSRICAQALAAYEAATTECPRCGKPPMNYDVKDGCRCGTESTKESK